MPSKYQTKVSIEDQTHLRISVGGIRFWKNKALHTSSVGDKINDGLAPINDCSYPKNFLKILYFLSNNTKHSILS